MKSDDDTTGKVFPMGFMIQAHPCDICGRTCSVRFNEKGLMLCSRCKRGKITSNPYRGDLEGQIRLLQETNMRLEAKILSIRRRNLIFITWYLIMLVLAYVVESTFVSKGLCILF